MGGSTEVLHTCPLTAVKDVITLGCALKEEICSLIHIGVRNRVIVRMLPLCDGPNGDDSFPITYPYIRSQH